MGLPKGGRMYPKFTSPRIITPQEQKRLLRVVRPAATWSPSADALFWTRATG